MIYDIVLSCTFSVFRSKQNLRVYKKKSTVISGWRFFRKYQCWSVVLYFGSQCIWVWRPCSNKTAIYNGERSWNKNNSYAFIFSFIIFGSTYLVLQLSWRHVNENISISSTCVETNGWTLLQNVCSTLCQDKHPNSKINSIFTHQLVRRHASLPGFILADATSPNFNQTRLVAAEFSQCRWFSSTVFYTLNVIKHIYCVFSRHLWIHLVYILASTF